MQVVARPREPTDKAKNILLLRNRRGKVEKEELIEIKCVGCGQPRLVPPKTIIAYLCPDCCKKLKQKINSENLKD
jgi:predicted RNA-binding Zn-ribbon protein involved in translation (DUF1610 family)